MEEAAGLERGDRFGVWEWSGSGEEQPEVWFFKLAEETGVGMSGCLFLTMCGCVLNGGCVLNVCACWMGVSASGACHVHAMCMHVQGHVLSKF